MESLKIGGQLNMLEIRNSDLVQAKSFLYDLKLKPKLSRHRTKLVKLIDEKIKDLSDASNEIIQQYAKKMKTVIRLLMIIWLNLTV